MLMPDDFRAFSKIKIDNHAFNKENLPSHFKVRNRVISRYGRSISHVPFNMSHFKIRIEKDVKQNIAILAFQVKEYCPLVFRNLRERSVVNPSLLNKF